MRKGETGLLAFVGNCCCSVERFGTPAGESGLSTLDIREHPEIW